MQNNNKIKLWAKYYLYLIATTLLVSLIVYFINNEFQEFFNKAYSNVFYGNKRGAEMLLYSLSGKAFIGSVVMILFAVILLPFNSGGISLAYSASTSIIGTIGSSIASIVVGTMIVLFIFSIVIVIRYRKHI